MTLAGLALALAFGAAPDSLAARERGHVGGRVAVAHGHGHGHGYYGYRGTRAYGLFGLYGLHGYYGYYGYGGWPPYASYPRPYPAPVYGTRTVDQPGAVETDVRPGRAQIRIDGEYAGEARDFNGTWDILWLSPGSHELEFSRDGYRSLKVRVDVDAGSYYRIRQRLNKGTGLDPRSEGLTAAAEGDDVVDRRRAVREDPPPAASDDAPGLESGFLTIDASPEDAAVYLDGRFLANAGELSRLHGALPVARGEHILEVVRPGFRSVKQRVTVDGDEPVAVKIRLERNGGST